MLNLKDEINKLNELGNTLKGISEKAEREISKLDINERNALLSFLQDIKEAGKSEVGINEVIENIKNYGSSR